MNDISEIWSEWHTEELLGRGAFGSVYKISKDDFGKTYYAAVKIIEYPSDESESQELETAGMDAKSIHQYFEENLNNLVKEIKIMESLKTAGHIVSIEDYKLVKRTDVFGWKLYIRMELLKSLDAVITEKGTLNEEEVCKIGLDICSALSCCEQNQTIHRDVKSSNIFVNVYGDYKLGDFGTSKQLENTMSVRSRKGTMMYMAPEVYRGMSYDHTVDLYSLGITMYRLLNHNRFPFMPPSSQTIRPGDVDRAMSDRISGKEMPDPDDCDTEMVRIIKKACAFHPENRYKNAELMKADLEKWLLFKKYGSTVNREESQTFNTDPEYEETYIAFRHKDKLVDAIYEENPIQDEQANVIHEENPIQDFVSRLYTDILGKEADPDGLEKYTDVLKSCQDTVSKVSMEFVNSDEFKNRDMNDEAFIDIMYRTFLGRAADEGGLSTWIKILDDGLSRMFVFRGFIESQEFTKICEEYGIIRGNVELTAPMDQRENENATKFVARLYKVFLGRKGDENGLNEWVTQLVTNVFTARQVAYRFSECTELQNKNLSNEEYFKIIFMGLKNREANLDDYKEWKSWLQGDSTQTKRAQLFCKFADSQEFLELVKSYGLKNS